MTNWPSIEYENVFAYFILRLGTYTQGQLLSWKQLESYSYDTRGWCNRWCLVKER